MKNIKQIGFLGVFALMFALTSCSDEAPIGSKVTNYAIITLNNDDDGDMVTLINQGDSYVEPGAIAIIDNQEVDVDIDGSVDTSTTGVYKIDYSSTNSDGFSRTITRTVIVMSAAPSTLNLEGTFFRSGNPNNIVRLSDRVYTADNAGGLANSAANDPNFLFVTFYVYDDSHVYIPEQLTPSGITVESISGNIINNNSFNWVLSASSFYGTAVRNFTR